MRDEDLIELLLSWGVTPTALYNGLLLLVLAAMVSLNVWLYKKVRQAGRDASSGASVPTMDWSQNSDELEINFPLSANKQGQQKTTTSSIECKITSTTIRFAFKGDEPMLEGTFYKKVVSDDCFWQFWPTGPEPTHVKLSLTKAKPARWKTVLSLDATGRLEQDNDQTASGGKQKKRA